MGSRGMLIGFTSASDSNEPLVDSYNMSSKDFFKAPLHMVCRGLSQDRGIPRGVLCAPTAARFRMCWRESPRHFSTPTGVIKQPIETRFLGRCF